MTGRTVAAAGEPAPVRVSTSSCSPTVDHMVRDETTDRVRAICRGLPDATERLSHGAPAFFVGKQFVTLWVDGHHDHDFPHLWCAAPDGAQEALVADDPERFFRPPYVGSRGWIGMRLDGVVDWDEMAARCEDAYRTVAPPRAVARLDVGAQTATPGGAATTGRKAHPRRGPLTMDHVAATALALPETAEGSRHGHRAWLVAGKVFAWERPFHKADIKRFGDEPIPEGPILALRVADLEDKEAVLAANRQAFFTIPHFDGYASVLVRLPAVTAGALEEGLTDAWLASAPARLTRTFLEA
jgi:hypothetical protein